MRLVCKRWNNTIENRTGLSVKLNDTLPGNITFISRVVKKELNIILLRNRTPRKLHRSYPNSVRSIRIYGCIRHTALYEDILQYPRIQKLHFYGEALSAKLTITVDLNFPHLEVFYCTSTADANVSGQKVLTASTITKLLTHIVCPQLRELTIDGNLSQVGLNDPYEWKTDILIQFLSRSKNTLNKLIIGENSLLYPWSRSDQDSVQMLEEQLPRNLKTIHISFRDNGFRHNPWVRLLQVQTQLAFVNFGALYYEPTLDIARDFTVQMKSLSIFWNMQTRGAIDLGLFSHLINLEKLELIHDGNWNRMGINFRSFRTLGKLKSLVLEHIAIADEDIALIPSMVPQLENLHLYRIGTHGEQNMGISNGMKISTLAKLFRMRSLNYLAVCISDINCTLSEQMTQSWSALEVLFTEYSQGHCVWQIGTDGNIPDFTRREK